MKKLTLICVLAALCLNFSSIAQKQSTVTELQIGDFVPEIKVSAVTDGTSRNIKFSDLKGKLIIIDFWATWCSSCIVAMPKTHALEQKFKEELFVLAVSSEKQDKVASFLKQNKTVKDLHLTTVIQDTVLAKLFPHRLLPHYVWIDPGGMVLAFTGAEDITEKNVSQILSKGRPDLTTKKDQNLDRPLYSSEELPVNDLIHYSILTKGAKVGLPGGTHPYQKGEHVYRRIFTNSTVLTMYRVIAQKLFLENGQSFRDDRLIIDVLKPEEIEYDSSLGDAKAWNSGHLYNFDVIVPITDAARLNRIMLEDLNRYLPYNGRIEKRRSSYLALVTVDQTLPIRDTAGKKIGLEVYVRRLMSQGFTKLPVIDETGYKEKVCLPLPEADDMESMNRELARFNLKLVNGEAPIDMFILSDKRPFPNATP